MFSFRKVFKAAGGHGSVKDGSTGAYGSPREQIESFYKSLDDGLRGLENSLPPDTLSFRVEWMQLAVTFLQRVHSETFTLVGNLRQPGVSRKSLGPEVMQEYLDVSMSLLEMCNNLKEGLDQLETYHCGLELALKKLIIASEVLQRQGGKVGADSDIADILKPVNEARKELERLDSSKSANSGSGRLNTSRELSRTKTMRQRAISPGKKSEQRAVSLLLYDVQVVTSFVSCVLLWALTGQVGESGDFTADLDGLEPSAKLGVSTSWPKFMASLKEKVSSQESIKDLEKSSTSMKLQDVKNFQNSLASVRAELKQGLEEGMLDRGTDFWERIRAVLDKETKQLKELEESLYSISMQLSDLFKEMKERRHKVLDAVGASGCPPC